MSQPTPYEQMGGAPFFTTLVHLFYEGVGADPALRPMYPDADLEPAEIRLRMFLEQYWGGPNTYSEERGHPRLRMRHAEFHIDRIARDEWLACMREAVADLKIREDLKVQLWEYLEMASNSMVNQPD